VHREPAGAACWRRHQEPQQAVLGACAHQIPIEIARVLTTSLIDLQRPGSDVGISEIARQSSQQLQLVHASAASMLDQARELLL
jgi:hypothetical protein